MFTDTESGTMIVECFPLKPAAKPKQLRRNGGTYEGGGYKGRTSSSHCRRYTTRTEHFTAWLLDLREGCNISMI